MRNAYVDRSRSTSQRSGPLGQDIKSERYRLSRNASSAAPEGANEEEEVPIGNDDWDEDGGQDAAGGR